MSEQPSETGRRAARKDDVRRKVEAALIDAIASGDSDRLSHDSIAAAAGVARRTLYRYYPDRQTLMQAAWGSITARAGPRVTFPSSEAEMLASLPDIYEGFDRIAPLAIVTRSTPQGRAVRLSQRERRVASYTAALADAVAALPPDDRRLATAVVQLLHTTAWLEMHDSWQLTGAEMARACGWAMRTLLADLRARGDRPLDAA